MPRQVAWRRRLKATRSISSWRSRFQVWRRRLVRRYRDFLSRRPHRSFRRTKQRDMPVHASLPGNIFFTSEVLTIIRRWWRTYLLLIVIYVLVYTLLIGIADQTAYKALTDAFSEIGTSVSGGDMSKTTQTMTLFLLSVSGGIGAPMTELKQLYLGMLGIFTWLVVVWLLRHRFGGVMVTVRDAIYNCGAPFIAACMIIIVGMLQLLPGAIAVLIYTTLESAEVLRGGPESMLAALATGLVVVLSLYWLTSTFFAAIIVTLPGTYPFRALRMAGDIVIGRRLSILLRLLWLAAALLVMWAFILIPMILLAGVIPWQWLPLVPLSIVILTGASIIIGATYIYLLYRKMIDEPAK